MTPTSSIMIDPGGERTIVTHRDPALWQVILPPADLLLDGIDAVLTASSHVISSADALRTSTRRDDLAAALTTLAPLTPAYLAVTSGADGTLWRETSGAVRHLPPSPWRRSTPWVPATSFTALSRSPLPRARTRLRPCASAPPQQR